MSILADAVAECTKSSVSVDFRFEDYEVRSILRNGEPWFVASDVCGALNLTNASKSVSSLDDDEKYLFTGDSNFKLGSAGNGAQTVILINESGLFTLILRCRDAVKQGTLPWRFRKWVTNEVLPTIRKTGRFEKKAVSEPLSNKDMSNLKRLVWMMTANMRFESSWNAGVWHCLRSVTGRPSPQAFSVEDLPALSEECRRIIKITSKVNALVADFEKDVIRKIVRKRGEFEPLLSEMNQKLVELQRQESDGLLMLGRLEESCIGQLSGRM